MHRDRGSHHAVSGAHEIQPLIAPRTTSHRIQQVAGEETLP